MRLFDTSRKQTVESYTIATKQRDSTDMSRGYSRSLKGLARFIQGLSERLSRKGQLILLSFFCVAAGSLSLYLMASSIRSGVSSSLNVINIATSPFIGRSGDESTKSDVRASELEYEKIKRFNSYMDTLARSPAGKKVYDSIVHSRPGLMDSVLFLEKMYQSQLKTKVWNRKHE